MLEPTEYEIRMANCVAITDWGIEEDADCPNYQKAKAWAIANGYFLDKDISYNGYIYIKKIFNLTEDPFDGNRIELQVYKETDNNTKYHHWQQWDMEADFGNIFDPIKYGFKVAHGVGACGESKDLDTILEQVLQRERYLVEAHDAYKKKQMNSDFDIKDFEAKYHKFLMVSPTTINMGDGFLFVPFEYEKIYSYKIYHWGQWEGPMSGKYSWEEALEYAKQRLGSMKIMLGKA